MTLTNADDLLNLLLKKEEVSWKTILTEVVRAEDMNPWDIDLSVLSKKFIAMLKKLQELDFQISGKVVLAAALLLKIKSKRLIGDDISRFDELFATKDEQADSFFDFGEEFNNYFVEQNKQPVYNLIPRTPQPRKRKVSIYDLIDALQQAMEVKQRRLSRYMPKDLDMTIPLKKVDITQIIREVFTKIKFHYSKADQKLYFSMLTGDNPSKEDIIYTFIPLLHLSNERKIDLTQEKNFAPIEIAIIEKK